MSIALSAWYDEYDGPRLEVAAVGLDDLGDHRDQTLVEFADVGIVGQQVQQHLPHRLDVPGVDLAGGADVGIPRRAPCARRTPPGHHRSNSASGLPVIRATEHRAGQTLAHHLAVGQIQHGEHLAGVDRFRRTHRNTFGTKGFHEPDEVAGQAVRASGCGGRGRRAMVLVQPQFAGRALLVGLVFEHHTQRGGDGGVVDGVHAERQQGTAPVDRFGHRGHLLELHGAARR